MPQRQPGLPVIETDGLTQQQVRDHQAQLLQVALVGCGIVLKEDACERTMELGLGRHGDLDWFRSPTLSWIPTQPMDCEPFFCRGSYSRVSQARAELTMRTKLRETLFPTPSI